MYELGDNIFRATRSPNPRPLINERDEVKQQLKPWQGPPEEEKGWDVAQWYRLPHMSYEGGMWVCVARAAHEAYSRASKSEIAVQTPPQSQKEKDEEGVLMGNFIKEWDNDAPLPEGIRSERSIPMGHV